MDHKQELQTCMPFFYAILSVSYSLLGVQGIHGAFKRYKKPAGKLYPIQINKITAM